MKKLSMLAGASLLVIAGSVFAAEPLNDAQMDGVSAGLAFGGADAASLVIVNFSGVTATTAQTFADNVHGVAWGTATAGSVGLSILNGGALATSQTSATAGII